MATACSMSFFRHFVGDHFQHGGTVFVAVPYTISSSLSSNSWKVGIDDKAVGDFRHPHRTPSGPLNWIWEMSQSRLGGGDQSPETSGNFLIHGKGRDYDLDFIFESLPGKGGAGSQVNPAARQE